ncbi:MAG: aminopeptidase [Candidatus Lokiarchaeota archaeon]|nr:aminopeptidase [Candidatus Lokiarchaeota archaeon]
MNDFKKMIKSAQKAMVHVLKLKKKDDVLVITDEHTKSEGEAFYAAAIEYGCTAHLYFLPEEIRPIFEIPTDLISLLKGKTLIINAFKGLAEETPFRVKWIDEVHVNKAVRVGHCPSITKSMMIEGPMNVDYDKMVVIADKMISSFNNAKQVHITAPGGTDVVLHIEDRGFSTDTQLIEESYLANLPCGEVWCGPVETKGDGLIVCDGSIGDIGNVSKPLKIFIEKGRIINVESEDQNLVENVEKLTSIDEEARIIGELGIGLNPGAKLTGNLLEDEKALKTAHIAFGNNEDMEGGQNRSKNHRDFLFYKPTMNITFKDGSSKVLIKDGDIL